MHHWRRFLLAKELSSQSSVPENRMDFRRLVDLGGLLGGVTATCFLLYRTPAETGARGSTEEFLEQVVPRLIPQLRRSTQPRQILSRGRARGRVDWPATAKARCGGNQDPTVFVCRESWRLYDLAENRLLKYLLENLNRCLHHTPFELSDWTRRLSVGERKSERVSDRLALIAYHLRRYRGNAYLRDVELPSVIASEHVLAARRARNPLYRQVADFYDHYVSVVETPRWDPWVSVLRQSSGLLPESEARILDAMMR